MAFLTDKSGGERAESGARALPMPSAEKTISTAASRLRAAARRASLAALLLVLLPLAPATRAATTSAEPAREYQVKAVFLFNFTQFVEWPETVFPNAASPIVIGVLGEDPFCGFLDDVVRDEQVRSRTLVIRYCRTAAEAASCHLLFIARSEYPRLEEIFAALRGRPILTVGDGDAFAQRGGIVRLLTDNKKIRFRVNVDAAHTAGLVISSKLLRAAEVVGAPAPRR